MHYPSFYLSEIALLPSVLKKIHDFQNIFFNGKNAQHFFCLEKNDVEK